MQTPGARNFLVDSMTFYSECESHSERPRVESQHNVCDRLKASDNHTVHMVHGSFRFKSFLEGESIFFFTNSLFKKSG